MSTNVALDSNPIRGRLRSSKKRDAAATTAANPVALPTAPAPRRARIRSNPNPVKDSVLPVQSRAGRKARKAWSAPNLAAAAAAAGPCTRVTRSKTAAALKDSVVLDLRNKVPATRKSRKAASKLVVDPQPGVTTQHPERASRPVRACTQRGRATTGAAEVPITPAAAVKSTRKRQAAVVRPKTPPPMRASESASGSSRSHRSADDASPTVAEQELMKEFTPICYTDANFLDDLYTDLASDDRIEQFLRMPDSGYGEDGRWTAIPVHPNSRSQLHAPIITIIRRIVDEFPLSDATGSSRTVVGTTSEHSDWPDIVIRATGPSFQVPLASSERLPGADGGDMDTLGYTNAASIFQVRRDRSKGDDLKNVTQLGLHCKEIWSHQPNRHFARALIITETSVRLVHYDRAGTFITPFCNYHDMPHILIRLILGLTSTDEKTLGLDTSIQWGIDEESGRKTSGTIASLDGQNQPVHYTMTSTTPRFSPHSIRGRGTTCWSVAHPDGGKTLLIKDAWRSDKTNPECAYLEAAKDLQGIVQMISYQDDLIRTDHFRPASSSGHCEYRNRSKLRIVMEAYGKSIAHFETRYQLVAAFKDAIRAHRRLHDALILHRDISAANILLGELHAMDGLRGFLIDLDMAIRLDCDPSDSAWNDITGTRIYQSMAVLEGYLLEPEELMEPHGYLDDLESFFYVLCHIVFLVVSPGKEVGGAVKSMIAGWESEDPARSGNAKARMVHSTFKGTYLDTQYWGTACQQLLKEFHAFIQSIAVQKDIIRSSAETTGAQKIALIKAIGHDVDEHYKLLDDIFQKALDGLAAEEPKLNPCLTKSWPTEPHRSPTLALPSPSPAIAAHKTTVPSTNPTGGLKRSSDDMQGADHNHVERAPKRRHRAGHSA